MPDYIDYFLNRSGAVHEIECLELSHPDFSQTYFIQYYDEDGISLTHEDGSSHTYQYVPLKIERANTSNDLDQKINITLGDMGQILPAEIKRIRAGSFPHQAPQLKYRLYRSDDLTSPLYVLQTLEVTDLTRDSTGAATFSAEAIQLNNTKTGEVYSLERFPLLRGVL